jgi:hypothetical protein
MTLTQREISEENAMREWESRLDNLPRPTLRALQSLTDHAPTNKHYDFIEINANTGSLIMIPRPEAKGLAAKTYAYLKETPPDREAPGKILSRGNNTYIVSPNIRERNYQIAFKLLK